MGLESDDRLTPRQISPEGFERALDGEIAERWAFLQRFIPEDQIITDPRDVEELDTYMRVIDRKRLAQTYEVNPYMSEN